MMPPFETAGRTEIEVQGRRIELTDLDRVIYPATGFTKAQLVAYYARVAPALTPHLQDRPLTLKRFPDGVGQPFFFERQCPTDRPPWIRVAGVWSEAWRREVERCMVDDLAGLVWVANLAAIELGITLHRADDVDRPSLMLIDMDPSPPAGLLECAEIALRLEDMIERFGLRAFPKTSGGRGLHLLIPFNGTATYAESQGFARSLASILARRHPRQVVATSRRELRRGKVLVDWRQNAPHKTMVAPYSLRARERPTVSMPLAWPELEDAVALQEPGLLVFEADQVQARIRRFGDLLAPVEYLEQVIPIVQGGRSLNV